MAPVNLMNRLRLTGRRQLRGASGGSHHLGAFLVEFLCRGCDSGVGLITRGLRVGIALSALRGPSAAPMLRTAVSGVTNGAADGRTRRTDCASTGVSVSH